MYFNAYKINTKQQWFIKIYVHDVYINKVSTFWKDLIPITLTVASKLILVKTIQKTQDA